MHPLLLVYIVGFILAALYVGWESANDRMQFVRTPPQGMVGMPGGLNGFTVLGRALVWFAYALAEISFKVQYKRHQAAKYAGTVPVKGKFKRDPS